MSDLRYTMKKSLSESVVGHNKRKNSTVIPPHVMKIRSVHDDSRIDTVLTRVFAPPVVRSYWLGKTAKLNEHCPEPGWSELFIDLVFVGQFIVLAKVMENCDDTFHLLVSMFCNFTIMWGCRNMLDHYFNKVGNGRSLNLFENFMYTVGLTIMIANTVKSSCFLPENQAVYIVIGFSIGHLICRSTMLCMCAHAMYCNQILVPSMTYDCGVLIFQIITTFMVIGMAHYQAKIASALLVLIVVVDLLFIPGRILYNYMLRRYRPDYTKREHLYPVPLDLYKVQERAGFWIIMVLGETIIQLAVTDPKEGETIDLIGYYVVIIGTLILTFVIGLIYFENCCIFEQNNNRQHALQRNQFMAAFWLTIQVFLSYFIFLLGPTVSQILDSMNEEEYYRSRRLLEDSERWGQEYQGQLSAVCFSIHIGLVLLDKCHENFYLPNKSLSSWRFDVSPWYIVIMFATAFLHFAVWPLFRLVGSVGVRLSWSIFIHAIIMTGPRLIILGQQISKFIENRHASINVIMGWTLKSKDEIEIEEMRRSVINRATMSPSCLYDSDESEADSDDDYSTHSYPEIITRNEKATVNPMAIAAVDSMQFTEGSAGGSEGESNVEMNDIETRLPSFT